MSASDSVSERYDVVVMGGGPGGATLATLLAQRTDLSVAVFERERFPREHIGESFSYRVIPVLESSGVLGKVLASDCWVKKYGGYYAWDIENPAATLFEHHNWERDGAYRWAIHCNRAEFDQILLEHAGEAGASVFQGLAVEGVTRTEQGHEVTLGDGRRVSCRVFVEASGRQTSVISGRRKDYLSDYKNIALWLHVVGGAPPEQASGDWNLFRRLDKSAIGSFACDDGWYWYIPVPKLIDGARVATHSLGFVTDPSLVKGERSAHLSVDAFMERARAVPLLGELLADASPVRNAILSATNYSMLSERFCDYDERWVLVGDSACFVDPLFSSGVAFALHHAASASLMIQEALENGGESSARDLWRDYDTGWKRLARSFALVIDQWYHAIADRHSDSRFWQRVARDGSPELRAATFQAVVDTSVSPDLVRVLTRGEKDDIAEVLSQGPIADARRRTADAVAGLGPRVKMAAGTRLRRGAALGIGQSRGSYPPGVVPEPGSIVARYWDDPIAVGPELPAMYSEPQSCWYLTDGETQVAVGSGDDAEALRAALEAGLSTAHLDDRLTPRLANAVYEACGAGLLTER